ncbi:hypothetical protein [Geodermatophilus sp. SYSU D01105]
MDPGTVPEMVDAVLARAASGAAFSDRGHAAVRTAHTAKARAGLLLPPA